MICAIFDLDGTLLDYEGASQKAMQLALDPFNKKFTKELHAAIIGTKDADWSVMVIRGTGLENQLTPAELIETYHAHIRELIPEMELMPGAEKLLRSLKQHNIPIAIATSSSAHVVPKKLSHHPVIMECVELIVTGDDPEVKNGKPAPDIFLLAADRLRAARDTNASPITNEKCIVFEDSPLGAAGAVAAGMITVAVPDKRFLSDKDINERFPQSVILLGSLDEFHVEKWM
jgi:HAD superfamily hydrolase (TIGR01509 family)